MKIVSLWHGSDTMDSTAPMPVPPKKDGAVFWLLEMDAVPGDVEAKILAAAEELGHDLEISSHLTVDQALAVLQKAGVFEGSVLQKLLASEPVIIGLIRGGKVNLWSAVSAALVLASIWARP